MLLTHRVDSSVRAAALATGCTIKIEMGEDFAYDLRQNSQLGGCFILIRTFHYSTHIHHTDRPFDAVFILQPKSLQLQWEDTDIRRLRAAKVL